ncbi:MAG: AAA family ATPase [Bacteroidia bacterium]|nr:AAA family ATPase [Bacteroidia bacterium]
MDFFRNRQWGPENPFSKTVSFKLTEQTRENFDEGYLGEGLKWGHLIKRLEYQIFEIVFIRRLDDRGNNLFQAFIPVFHLVQGAWLRVTFRPDDRGPGFFVIYLAIERNNPNQFKNALVDNYELKFLKVWEEVEDVDSFWELQEKLVSLPLTKVRRSREVNAEIEIWNKYLLALEKVMKDKSVLIPVREGKEFKKWNNKRKFRETVIEYQIDKSEYSSRILKEFGELEGADLQIKEERGVLKLPGNAYPDTEVLEEWQQKLNSNHFQFDPEQRRCTWHLDFWANLKFRDNQSQEQLMKELDRGLRFSKPTRKKQSFYCKDWNSLATVRSEIEKFSQALVVNGMPEVIINLRHRFESPETREKMLREAEEGLKTDERVSKIVREPGDLISITSDKNLEISLKTKFSDFEIEQLEGRVSFPAPEKGSSLPDLKEAEKRGNAYVFQADSWESLQKLREKVIDRVKLKPLDLDSDLEINYKIKLDRPWLRKNWQAGIERAVQGQKGVTLNFPVLKIRTADEQALAEVFDQLDFGKNDTIPLVDGINLYYKFLVEDGLYRKDRIRALQGKLTGKFAGAFSVSDPKGEHWGFQAGLKFSKESQLSQGLQGLEELEKEFPEFDVLIPNKSGTLQMHFHFSDQSLSDELESIWHDLKNKEMKFLSYPEVVEYIAEAEGKGGNYKGGIGLGKLSGLRGGIVRIRADKEEEEKFSPNYKKGFLLPVFVGDLATLNRLKWAINTVKRPGGDYPKNRNLANFIFNPSAASEIEILENIRSDKYWQLKHALNEAGLNEKQKEAVWKAINAKDMVLIQGPPGTGKTTVIAEIIWQMLQENPDSKILISSQAHLAVDNALERLYKKNLIRPLRVASSKYAKKSIEPEGQKYVAEVIQDWARAAPGSKENQDNQENAVKFWLDRVSQMAQPEGEFASIQIDWAKRLQNPAPDIKKFFTEIYLNNVNIVAATCLECGQKDFKEQFRGGFDCVIVDEASKATPPEMLLPLILGRKVIIIGDHKQLPPMIDDKEIGEVLKELGEEKLAGEMDEIKTAQFEKLFMEAPESTKVTLQTQYRMHKQIMQVINAFYEDEGGLICGIEGSMDNPDLTDRGSRHHGISLSHVLRPNQHVLWVDVQTPETFHNPSFSNQGEVDAIRAILTLLASSLEFQQYMAHWPKEEDREIGIISFYGKQVEKLEDLRQEFIGKIPVRLRTVDKFQGMERNIMIVSTVRSDTQVLEGGLEVNAKPNKSIGFAKDFRRINVAFSRARRLLIIVGNEAHFSSGNGHYKIIEKVIGKMGGRLDITQLKA